MITPNIQFFTGVVEDYASDPFQLGRVKVRAFGIHPEDKLKVPTEDLPWAIPILSPTFGGSNGVGTGAQILGGTWVFGFFMDGSDAQHPYILGSIPNQGTNMSFDPCAPGGTGVAGNQGVPPGASPSANNPVGAGTAVASSTQAVNFDIPPEGRALLDTIAGTESPGYNVIYGGQTFSDYSQHPNISVPIRSGPNAGLTSDAAGRYQFLGSTWAEVARQEGLTDFSPHSQDWAAWQLATNVYYQRTGNDILTDLKSNDPATIARVGTVLSGTWTSLPGGIEATTNQNRFTAAYNANMAVYNAAPNYGDQGTAVPPTGAQDQGFRDATANGPAQASPPAEESNPDNKTSSLLQNNKNPNKFPIANEKNGGLTKEASPHHYPSYPHTKAIVTPSGHKVIFDDTASHEAMTIQHRDGSHVEFAPGGNIKIKSRGDAHFVMDKNGTMMVGGRFNLSILGSGYLYMGNEANIQVDGNGELTFGNDVNINIAGNANINVGELAQIKAASMKFESTGGIDFVSAKGINFATNGPMNIRADDLFMTAEGDTHILGVGDVKINSKGDLDIRGNGNTKLFSEGDLDIKGSGSTHLHSEGEMNIKGDGALNMEGSGAVHIDGSTVDFQTGSASGASEASVATAAKKAVGTGMGKAGVAGKGAGGAPGRVANGPEKVYLPQNHAGAGQFGVSSGIRPPRNPATVRQGVDNGTDRQFVSLSDVAGSRVTTAFRGD